MEFNDRKPEFPGRVRLTPIGGDMYNLTYEEGRTSGVNSQNERLNPGTPLNAATFKQLQDELKREASAWVSNVYGVRIDTTNSNPETSVVYTDDAFGFVSAKGNYGSYQKGTIESCYPYNRIRPCLLKDGVFVGYLDPNDYNKFSDGRAADISSGIAGDVMIEIPHFWYKLERVNNFLDVKISNMEREGFTDFAFSYNGEVKDQFYIGAYLGSCDGSGKLRSLSGAMPNGNLTMGQFRTAAQANGEGYEQLSFNKLTALQVLYLLQFKSLNSQSALGQGYTNNIGVYIANGAANKKGMNYGSQTSNSPDSVIKFNGIENFWGNMAVRIDGFISNGTNSIAISDGNFNDYGAGYKKYSGAALPNPDNFPNEFPMYMKDVMGDNNLGFIPRAIRGSSSTYYCDYGFISNSGNRYPGFGGDASTKMNAGAFRFYCDYATASIYSYLGARLVYNI